MPHEFAFRSSNEEHCHFGLMMKAVQLDSHMMIKSLKDLADHRLPRFPLRTNPTHKTLSQIQQGRQSNMFAQTVCLCVRRDKPRENVDAEMDVKWHVFFENIYAFMQITIYAYLRVYLITHVCMHACMHVSMQVCRHANIATPSARTRCVLHHTI